VVAEAHGYWVYREYKVKAVLLYTTERMSSGFYIKKTHKIVKKVLYRTTKRLMIEAQ